MLQDPHQSEMLEASYEGQIFCFRLVSVFQDVILTKRVRCYGLRQGDSDTTQSLAPFTSSATVCIVFPAEILCRGAICR